MSDDKLWICSYDVGKRNFAFYIEEMDRKALQELPKIPKTKRYNADGTTTPEFGEVLRQLCGNGKTILFKNNDLTENTVKGKYLDPEIFHNLTDLMDKYTEYWDKCEAFVIEMQMAFRGKYNTMALKIGQHCYSYLAIRYGRFKPVIEFPAYHKTLVLGAQKIKTKWKSGKVRYKNIDKPARKKWCVEKATAILAERNDFKTMSELTSKKKKDDLADVLCQLQAFKVLVFIDKCI